MKIKRQKKVRRNLNFYKNNFQFRKPYQVLVDATFCQEALKCKLNMSEQFPKYLEDPEIKLFTTSCVIMEAVYLGSKVFGAMVVVKQFQTRRCCHEIGHISAADCLYYLVENGNPEHYFVATQDRDLTEKIRKLPGVPLLYINYNAINLEQPSAWNTGTAEQKIEEKLKGSKYEAAVLKKLKSEVLGEEAIAKRTRKKIKGPNPLSCKKKKTKPVIKNEKVATRQRHRRGKKSEPATK